MVLFRDGMDPNNNSLNDLLARTALQDRRAFQELYRMTSAKLNGVAFCLMNNVDFANEVTQEAFIQIWRNAADYRPEMGEPMTWMYAIVRYRAYDRLRADKRRAETKQIVSFEPDEYASHDNDPAANCGVRQRLAECLQSLERNQRQAVLLAYYNGYSRDELAARFKTPVNTVKSWLRRALMRLQTCLSQ
ncbi:sigma-70 family RNA polymerase sigma factor [Bowmanella dokdonensis]